MKSNDSGRIKHELLVFYITTILLTWVFWLLASILKYNVFMTVGIFVPSIAGFIFAYVFGGKMEVLSLFKSLINIRIRIKWLLYIFLVLPGISAFSTLTYYLLGNSLPQMEFPPLFIPVVFIYILVFMGPLGEEAGWRGFALKRMLIYLSPIKSSVLIGLIWASWHLPLFFIEGTTQNILTAFGIIPALLGYLIYTVMLSILITLLFIKSDGSVFGSILLHTMGNLSLGFMPLIFNKNGALILLITLCISTVVIAKKSKSL